MKNKPLIVIFIAVLICTCNAKEINFSESEIDSMLISLKPLPKVHYYWPLAPGVEGRKLYELARITHSLCLSAKWTKKQQIDKYVYNCERVNKTNPKIKTFLGVEFSPFADEFDKNVPPTDRGASYFNEIGRMKKRAELVKKWIAAANKKYKSNIKVGAILLDFERFHVKAGDEKWNDGIREALDTVHLMLQSIFPEARMEWYGRGIRGEPGRWSRTPYWTGKEIKAPLSCSLYKVPKTELTRETFRRTVKLADEMGIQDVTPWVALASGFRMGLVKGQYFDTAWDYDIIDSYRIGAELNNPWYAKQPERFAPYNRAKVIILYPRPFNKPTKDWPKHFIAYVRGATNVRNLEDLGYEE